MAPNRADTAVASQRQARRSVPRIVPAIPHRFSRPPASARPITPDESTVAVATQPESEPQAATEKAEERVATPVQTPLTPDSKASALNNGDVEEPILASSPARSGDDHVEEALDARVVSKASQQNSVMDNVPPSPPAQLEPAPADGDRPKLTAPAELPPEFHPKGTWLNQTPPLEDTEALSHDPANRLPSHRPHPSVEGLVFGGAVQESPAMPSTPQEAEPEARLQQQMFTRPPPGFAAPHLAPQFFPGHSHHPSDLTTPWLYPTYSMAPPPDAVYANGHEYHASSFPAGSAAFEVPYQSQIPAPADATLVVNGTTRSQSQSPSKSQFGDIKPGYKFEEEFQSIPYANGLSSQQPGTSYDGYGIAKHLSSLFSNPELTDYILHIHSQEASFLSLPIHAAVVSRSPVIYEAIRHSSPPAYPTKDHRRLADVLVNDRFVTHESLHEGVKVLYAAPLLSVQSFLYGINTYDGGSEVGYAYHESRKRMSQAISYAAAGRVLQIPEMQACGLRIVNALIRWDTLDQVLHFTFAAGTTTVQPSGVGADSRLLETYAVPLLDDAIDFIARNFPADFSFYSLAPELQQNPRLPTSVDHRQPTHNPRLSKIRFGEAPVEDDFKPNYVTQTLSSILLSLPPAPLERLFNHPAAANQVGWSGLVKILREVVDERERRRNKVLKSVSEPKGAIPRALLENLHREEQVVASTETPSGYKLTATRIADRI